MKEPGMIENYAFAKASLCQLSETLPCSTILLTDPPTQSQHRGTNSSSLPLPAL